MLGKQIVVCNSSYRVATTPLPPLTSLFSGPSQVRSTRLLQAVWSPTSHRSFDCSSTGFLMRCHLILGNDAHLTLGNIAPVSWWSTCQPSQLLLIDPWLGVVPQRSLLLRCPCYRAPVMRNGLVVLSNRLRGQVNLRLIDGGSRWWRHSASALGVSAKDSPPFNMHGSRFYVSLFYDVFFSP